MLLLDHNHLTKLDDGLFHDLQFLQKVELSNNLLTHIDQSTFVNLPNVNTITLNGNKLTKLDTKTFEKLENLQSLELWNNSWYCDCQLMLLRKLISRRGFNTFSTICLDPPSFKGINWNDVSDDKFCDQEIIPEVTSISKSEDNCTKVQSSRGWNFFFNYTFSASVNVGFV